AQGVHAIGVLGARRGGSRARPVLPEGGVVLLDAARVGAMRKARDRGRGGARVLAVRAPDALSPPRPVPDRTGVDRRRVPLLLLRRGGAPPARAGRAAGAGRRARRG